MTDVPFWFWAYIVAVALWAAISVGWLLYGFLEGRGLWAGRGRWRPRRSSAP